RSSAPLGAPTDARSRPLPWRRYVARGFIANAINPKVALFFLAFLPQFVSPAHGVIEWQMVVLRVTFAVQTISVFGAIAFAAGRIGILLAHRPRLGPWLDRLAGGIFLGLAAHLLLTDRPG